MCNKIKTTKTIAVLCFATSCILCGYVNGEKLDKNAKSRYAGIPESVVDVMPEFEKNHKDVINMYARLYQGYQHLAKLHNTFGKKLRPAAERDAKKIERNISRAYDDFLEDLQDVLSGYETERDELKQKMLEFEGNVDLTDPESITKMRDKTTGLRKQIHESEKKIRVIKAMGTSLSELQEKSPSIYTFLKISERSYRTVDIEEFEDLIEAFYEFKDAQADLERMQAKKKDDPKNWSPMDNRALEKFESDLNDAREDTMDELKDLRAPLLDGQEDLNEDLEKLEERKARASDRRKSSYQEDIDEIDDELEKTNEKLALLKKFEDALGVETWK